MIKIKIPATSANLGAGFDALGLAVSLYNEVNIAEDDRLTVISVDGTDIPCDETNLIYTTVKQLCDLCGRTLSGLRIEQVNRIPMTRGLGSSSACIVAGLLAGNMLLDEPMKLDDLVDLAARIEGHPDNTTPALLGGIVTSVFDGKRVFYVRRKLTAPALYCNYSGLRTENVCCKGLPARGKSHLRTQSTTCRVRHFFPRRC